MAPQSEPMAMAHRKAGDRCGLLELVRLGTRLRARYQDVCTVIITTALRSDGITPEAELEARVRHLKQMDDYYAVQSDQGKLPSTRS